MPCSPGMSKCKLGCLHRQFVREYVSERDTQEVRAEAVTGGYTAETDEYFLMREEKWTFKRWLTTHARRGSDWLGTLSGPASAAAFVGEGLDTFPEV